MVERITINVGLGALLTNSNQVGALQSKIGQLEKDGYEIISIVNGQKSVWNHIKDMPVRGVHSPLLRAFGRPARRIKKQI